MNRGRTAGIAGLIAGAVAAGAAGGFALERRAVGRVRDRPDPEAREPFGRLHSRGRTVLADDGVPLHVEEAGDPNASLTVVFVHGFCLSMDCWHYQRRDLTDVGHLVFYDQRSHGGSGRSPREHATIDQLGHDLYSVLQATAPRGPVILVGHSMGGMTIMALADQRPDLFGDRILGVALISTSTGKLGETLLGMPAFLGRAVTPIVPGLAQRANRHASLIERGRQRTSDLSFMLTRRVAFGPDAPPSLVAFLEQMMAGTPIEVMTEFFSTFIDHDKLKALDVLRGVDTLVIVGDRDVLTPADHSRVIAGALADAELVLLQGAGHMVIMERPGLVNVRLRGLARRALRQQRSQTCSTGTLRHPPASA